MAQTSSPSSIQASCHPLPAITAEAMSGKAIMPMEWDMNRVPIARPRIRMNHRETTTEDPIWTGLAKITRPTP